MIRTIQAWAANSLERWKRACIAVFVCATIAVASVTSLHAHSSESKPSENLGEWKSATVSDIQPRLVRVASNQKQPSTNASKSAAAPTKQPAPRKPTPKKTAIAETSEPANPADSEDLPTLPLKAVVPL